MPSPLTNDIAWDQRGLSADEIATITRENRMLATPYTKLLCSQWNVDQSAAAVLMAAETATALGVPRDQWVFAHSAAESNQMVVMPRRAEIHRWPAFEAVADALGLRGPDAIVPALVELYSCFPAAVQVQAAALGLPIDSPLTVSGGMTFGGGPLNSSVLQGLGAARRSIARAAGRHRTHHVGERHPHQAGRIVVVGHAAHRVASAPPMSPRKRPRAPRCWTSCRMRPDRRRSWPTRWCSRAPSRHARVAVLDVEGGRTIARCTDVGIASAMTESDWVGRTVRVTAPGVFVAD